VRIALTHNLRRAAQPIEAEAEFDSPETIASIAQIVESLGHHVTPLDVGTTIDNSEGLNRLVAALRWIRPDLVLNLAEGERGPFREAFYPALFDLLGLAYTGSSPSALALCLDKALATRVVGAAGVTVPRGTLVQRLSQVPPFARPVIVKPNYEGASKGITGASVVTSPGRLAPLVGELLDRYDRGVIVEDYVAGVDVSVGFVAGLGLLPPIAYRYEATGRFPVYDYRLKHEDRRSVTVEVPARLPDLVARRLHDAAGRAFTALGVAGYGRADFRVTPRGGVVFLEMNPLPSFDPDEIDLYGAAAAMGRTPADMFGAIISDAARPLDSPVRHAR
jgi:D-alanine-D-alanine ligase